MNDTPEASLTVLGCSGMHVARSGNSSRDELPAPGDYRTDDPEGKVPCLQYWGHLRDMWIVYPCSLIHSEQLSCSEHFHPESFTGTRRLSDSASGGEGSMFCMLEGGGGHTDSVFVFVVFF